MTASAVAGRGRLALLGVLPLDRIILRTVRAALTVGLLPAYLIWRLNMTYRYDNRREGIVGKNPAMESRASLRARLLGPVQWLAERSSWLRTFTTDFRVLDATRNIAPGTRSVPKTTPASRPQAGSLLRGA